jgi:HEAT repeat protein
LAAFPALLEAARDKDEDIRDAAAEALARATDWAHFEEMLRDKDKDVRIAAAYALGYAGSGAIPALLEALNDKDKDIREAVAHALANRSSDREAATSALTRLREDEDADTPTPASPPVTAIQWLRAARSARPGCDEPPRVAMP